MNVVGTSYFDTYANYQVGYDLLSQSRENNSSTVRFYGVLNVTGNSISWSSGSAWVYGSQWGLGTYYSRGSYVVVQQDVVLYHNANGDYTGTLNGGINTSYKSGNASGQFTLPHIDRYAVLTGGMNFTDEGNPTLTFTNQGLFDIRAKLEAGGDAHLIERDLPRNATSYTFDLTAAERNTLRQMCTGKTMTVRETIVSMNGSSEIGASASWKDYTMSIVNGEPVFEATYEDTNPTTLAITNDDQQIIRNNSTLEFNITDAAAKKYATLVSLKASINGVEYNGALSGTTGTIDVGELNISSNINVLVSLTDSRGFITTKDIALEILNWEQPTAIIEAQRRNNFYDETDVKVDANYSSLDNKNTISIKLRKKKTTEQSYDTYVDLNDNVLTTILMDNSFDWDVQIVVADKIGTSTYNLLIGKGIPIVFFDRIKRSMGINCFPENDTSLEVNNTIRVLGDLIVDDGNSPVNILQAILGNSMEIIEDNNKTSIKFANGLLINTIVHAYSNIAVSTQWGGIYASATHQTDSYLTPFTTLFSVNMNAKPAGGNHWMMETEDAATPTTTAPSVQFLRGASGTATGSIMIIAIGKWN